MGVYGLTAATAVPLLLGIGFRRVSVSLAWLGSIAALVIHFGLFFHGEQLFPNVNVTFGNPGVTAAIAAMITIPATALIAMVASNRRLIPSGS